MGVFRVEDRRDPRQDEPMANHPRAGTPALHDDLTDGRHSAVEWSQSRPENESPKPGAKNPPPQTTGTAVVDVKVFDLFQSRVRRDGQIAFGARGFLVPVVQTQNHVSHPCL